ncbi:MAG: branched-chain amino acid ABC transporter permease [Pelagibacterium sp.]|jgi:branched-chain amino acid transport system permease protein|uniref:branched-chain amino acid ABC transporter permease n=1 Tax=Pelagibacterium sp. TaxID=1967288 RepID=UPI0032ED8776|tara:strand:- start:71012 stop:71881 length:870 start_codon:yes stop_codon:yes gene_type:complete
MNSLLTPAVAGLSAGGAYAILGVCAIFTYRLVAVVNFTGAAIGGCGAFVMVVLTEHGMPLLPAVAIGVFAGALAALAVGFMTTIWFSGSSASVKAAVTAALLVGIIAMGLRLTGGQHPKHFPDLVGGAWLRVADVQITNASLVTIAMAVVLTVAAELFLARTRTGLELRALSERPMAAELLGIRVRLLALGVWAVAGAVTSFALMLIAPLRSPDFASLSLLVVPALAAALVGAFRSFRAALAGGLLIGVVEGLASGLVGLNQYRAAVPLLVILLVLLWSQRGARWDEAR